MTNPYDLPTPAHSSVALTDGGLSTRQQLLIALLSTIVLSIIGVAIHYFLGLPVLGVVIENQIWVLFIVTSLSLIVSLTLNPRGTAIQITRLVCAFSGLAVLICHAFVALKQLLFDAPIELFVYYQRAFGQNYGLYWIVIAILGLLPAIYFVSRIRTSFWPSFTTLLVIFVVGAFYIRFNYVLNYSDTLLSSWRQFIWPF